MICETFSVKQQYNCDAINQGPAVATLVYSGFINLQGNMRAGLPNKHVHSF